MDDEQLLLIDTDLFILLSGSGLVDRVVDLLGFSIQQVRRLEPLPHMLKKSRTLRKNYPQAIRDQALADCERVAGLVEQPTDTDVINRLIQIDRIDDGEALLYATVHEKKCWLLGSGDKNAMQALAKAETVADVRDGLSGRVISLETVCELLLQNDDVNEVASAFSPLCKLNKSLMVFFGSGGPYTKEDRLRSVTSYRRDLETTVGEDFLYRVESD